MRKIWLIVLAVLLVPSVIFALIPHLDAPDWEIMVVDSEGHPAAGVDVREEAQDYSCESDEHEVTLTSDAQGRVHFPAIYIHRNILRCIAEIGSESMSLAHASFGRHAYAFPPWINPPVSITDEHGNSFDWTGQPTHLKSILRLKQP